MKKIILFVSACLLVLYSCDNEERVMDKDSKVDNVMLTYDVDTDLLNSINANLAERLGTDTRTNVAMTEQEAQEILSPLVQQGCEMRNELVQLAEDKKIDLSAMEVKELKDMKDQELAEFAYFMQAVTQEEFADYDEMHAVSLEHKYTRDDVWECFKYAVGLQDLEYAVWYYQGTKALMSAKRAFSIIKPIIKRTAGWIGLAYTIYQFGDCLHGKKSG